MTLSRPTPIYGVHFVKTYLPLSLGMLFSSARQELDDAKYDLTPSFVSSMEELSSALRSRGPGVVLFSDYMWNVKDHAVASRWVKENYPECITVHGGPSVPSHPRAAHEFLASSTHVDFACLGEGERTLVELLRHLCDSEGPPREVAGLIFMQGDQLVRTPARERSANLDDFPSPYLTGIFDDIVEFATYALLETNRGCPYRCTFCDWGSATNQKIRTFSLERVRREIQWLSAHRMSDLYITDANFGILKRDVEICRLFCAAKESTGYPQRVILSYAKNTKTHLIEIVELMERSHLIGSGVMSMQSRDPETLQAIRRTNIKVSEYDKLRQAFNDRELPLDTHLMLGLPGSTRESFKRDLRYFFFQDINVRVFQTVLLVNSPMAEPEYVEKYQIETDSSGAIVSTSSMPRNDLAACDAIARLFRCAHDYGMLRYLLSFLAWDFGIDPIDFLDELSRETPAGPAGGPRLLGEFVTHDELNEAAMADFLHVPKDLSPDNDAVSPVKQIQATHIRFREARRKEGSWAQFYDEVDRYIARRYPSVDLVSMRSVLAVQAALMPTKGRSFPFTIQVEHDFAAYYKDHDGLTTSGGQRLADYPPGIFQVEDPLRLSENGSFRNDWSLTDVWQLKSDLAGAGRSTLGRFLAEHAEHIVPSQ